MWFASVYYHNTFVALLKSKSIVMQKIIAIAISMMTTHFVAFSQTVPQQSFSQAQVNKMKPKLGLKIGYNYAKLVGTTPNFSPKSNNGFMVSGFFAPATRGGMGYRTEIVFSRQGFSFDEAGKLQHVTQDYIYMPHLTTFTIAKLVQLQVGGQVGYLINAKKTTSSTTNEGNTIDYLNHLDYGLAGGLEVYPLKGLLIGGRYNISLGNIYKNYSSETTTVPSPFPFDPSQVKGKNAVVQFFVGYVF
jgi:hypothetical protein